LKPGQKYDKKFGIWLKAAVFKEQPHEMLWYCTQMTQIKKIIQANLNTAEHAVFNTNNPQ
jgi:hypothetical protein